MSFAHVVALQVGTATYSRIAPNHVGLLIPDLDHFDLFFPIAFHLLRPRPLLNPQPPYILGIESLPANFRRHGANCACWQCTMQAQS